MSPIICVYSNLVCWTFEHKTPYVLGLWATGLNLSIKENKRRLAVSSKETIPDLKICFDPSG